MTTDRYNPHATSRPTEGRSGGRATAPAERGAAHRQLPEQQQAVDKSHVLRHFRYCPTCRSTVGAIAHIYNCEVLINFIFYSRLFVAWNRFDIYLGIYYVALT